MTRAKGTKVMLIANKAPQEQPSEARKVSSMTGLLGQVITVNRNSMRGEAKGTCKIFKAETRCVLQRAFIRK